MWYIHTLKYDSAIKKKKDRSTDTRCSVRNLKKIMLSERSQTLQVTHRMFPLT